jgi:tetratricopeptide (TPR) repeat protein
MGGVNARTQTAFVLTLALAACGGDETGQSEASGAGVAGPSSAPASPEAPGRPVQPPQLARSEHDAVQNAIRALEEGDLPEANRSILEIPQSGGLDRVLLRARLRALEGDAVGAVRAVESARTDWPDQGRVYATAAEIHAAAGRIESATDEVRRGLEAAGPTPALSRARGVLSLSRQGGADLGLEHLLEARRADPELPFCDRALSQAHVLLGRKAMAADRPLEALGHAKAAQLALAEDVEARELAAEALEAGGDFDGALAAYEALLADGVDVRATLAVTAQRGSTAALLASDRALALERALRARELGLSAGELGFGTTLIEQETDAAIDTGIAHFAAEELDQARAAFELALRCTPDSLEAHNHLAVTLYRAEDPSGAARHWRAVVQVAEREDLELPEPVHLHLARALRDDGREGEARKVLEGYLAARPDGRWASDTTAALDD